MVKGYVGHIKMSKDGRVVESNNVENPEKLAQVLDFDVKKGNEEARELGFGRMHGFAIIGEKKSLTFMKGEALIVETDKADWQELFLHYVYNKGYIVVGAVLLVLTALILYLDIFTSAMDWLAPEPRYYIPTILALIGVFFLGVSKTSLSYRL